MAAQLPSFQQYDIATTVYASLRSGKDLSAQDVLHYFHKAKEEELRPATSSFLSVARVAAAIGRTDILEKLLDAGCERSPPIYYGAIEGKIPAVFECLFKRGWDINTLCMRGDLSILALVCRDEVFCNWLIAQGADPNVANDKGITPLSMVVHNAPADVVERWLYQKGGRADQGWLLHYAVRRNEEEIAVTTLILKCLGEHAVAWLNTIEGAGYDEPSDPIERMKPRGTPLHLAAKYQKLELVKYLFEQGADLSKPDSRNQLPVYYARDPGVLSFLKNKNDSLYD